MDSRNQSHSHHLRRPSDGWAAWQMTVGYIGQHYGPDVFLMVQVQPTDADQFVWTASISWRQQYESGTAAESIAAALAQLWQTMARYHKIFRSPDDAFRAPSGYAESEWLDASTDSMLHRILSITSAVYDQSWRLALVYRPAEIPAERVQVRLLDADGWLHIGGSGPALLEALRDMLRNAVPAFRARVNNDPASGQ